MSLTVKKTVTIDKTISQEVDVDIYEDIDVEVEVDLDDFAKLTNNSTIRYIADAFEDREVMETLEKLFMHKKITKRQIITHLETLLHAF